MADNSNDTWWRVTAPLWVPTLFAIVLLGVTATVVAIGNS